LGGSNSTKLWILLAFGAGYFFGTLGKLRDASLGDEAQVTSAAVVQQRAPERDGNGDDLGLVVSSVGQCSAGAPKDCQDGREGACAQQTPLAPLIDEPAWNSIYSADPGITGTNKMKHPQYTDIFRSSRYYTSGPGRILCVGTGLQGPSFLKLVESLNDGGWTVLWDQVTDASGKTTVRFAQYWNHGGKRCETIELDSKVTLEEIFAWQWDSVFIENGANNAESLRAATVLVPSWWESMVKNNSFKDNDHRGTRLVVLSPVKDAVYLDAVHVPTKVNALCVIWHHKNDMTDHHKRFAMIKANLASRAPFVPSAGASVDYRGFSSDRSDKSGEVQYTFSFDVQVTEAFEKRRFTPKAQDVRDWVWGDKDPYDLSAFPGIQAEIKRVAMPATQLSAAVLYCELIKAAKPGLIVELGVFRGGSSIDAANCIKTAGKAFVEDAFVVSIDTWLNDFCMQASRKKGSASYIATDNIYCQFPNANGASLMYYGALTSIKDAGHSDIIVPFPASTMVSSHAFMEAGWAPQLIFVDASHAFADVLIDMENWYAVLACGGLMYGDDHMTAGVNQAVNAFIFKRGWTIDVVSLAAKYWLLPPKVDILQSYQSQTPLTILTLLTLLTL
jgi:cephalosporin hydroxylase